MHAVLTLILSVLLSFVAVPGWAASDKRVALVIGNSAYRKFPQLPNPKNDAEDVTAALKRVGFEVIGGTDMTREAMRDSLRQFARAAQDAEAALVFYAGHGLQYRGRNYLVPVDAKLQDEFDLEYETVRVDDVVEELSRADGAKIMILDACRNLPLSARARDPFGSTGLAKLSGRGLIVAYATQANQVAYDGTGRNSIFTGAFVKAVQEPGIDATQMFQRVSMNVDKATGGRQTPELSLSYPGQFFFSKGETEREAWPRARASGDPQVLRDFIAKYPSSFLVDDAKDLIQRIEERRAPQVAQEPPRQQFAARPDDPAAGRSKEENDRIVFQRLQEEQKRRAEARQQAEQDRIAEEARQKKQAEEKAVADVRDRQRQAQEAKLEEARQKKLDQERAVAEAKERQRQAQEAKLEEDRRRAEAQKLERDRVAEEARQKKLDQERNVAEAKERQRQVQEAKLEEDRRRVEAQKLERDRVAEEGRLKKLADDAAAAEARDRQRQVQEARLEEERRQQEARRAEQDRAAEEARQRQQASAPTAAPAPEPNTQFAYAAPQVAVPQVAAPQNNDSMTFKQLEEEQKRRAQMLQAERAAAPDATPETVSAPADGSVDATLAAVKSRTTSPNLFGDRAGSAGRQFASNDASQQVVTSPPPASGFPVEALDRDKLVTATQTELGRIGCYADEVDGKWDRDTRDAMRRFGRHAKLAPIPSEPTAALLEDLKSRPEHFCPVECGSGQRAEGDQCVAVARPEPVERKAKPRPVVVQERRAPAEPRPVVARPRPQAAPPQAPVSTAASAPRQVPRAVMGVGF